MDSNQLKQQYAAKLNEAKTLAAQWKGKEGEMPKEVAGQIDSLLGQADELKIKIDLEARWGEG
jgi:hypothetical protein